MAGGTESAGPSDRWRRAVELMVQRHRRRARFKVVGRQRPVAALTTIPPEPLAMVLVTAIDGLASERLVLRRPRRDDVDAVLALADDVVVTTNGWPKDHARRVRRTYGDELLTLLSTEVLLVDRAGGQVRGSLSINNVREAAASCELGWWLGPDWRGQGYGTEAVQLVIPALHAAGAREVLIGTAVDNIAVQRVADRVGARELPSRRHTLPNGRTVDSLWFVHEAPLAR